jgi:acetate kinase
MGFSTLDGIPMATRCGSIDPGLLLHLLGPLKLSLHEVEDILYHQSGLIGVSGFSADSRELLASGRPEAREALALFAFRTAGEIARLVATLGGIDALVFTAGIGQHQPQIRAAISQRLGWLGLELDPIANDTNAETISANHGRIRAFVIPTDEEQVIAEEAVAVLLALSRHHRVPAGAGDHRVRTSRNDMQVDSDQLPQRNNN